MTATAGRPPSPSPAHPLDVRQSLRLELESARADFHAVLAGLSDEEWRKPSHNPGWTNGEVIFHMTLGFMILAALVPLVRFFGRLPPWASRIYASILDGDATLQLGECPRRSRRRAAE